jgi:cellobiose-specific phosphotransferase system component IIC
MSLHLVPKNRLVWESLAQHLLHRSFRSLRSQHCTTYTKKLYFSIQVSIVLITLNFLWFLGIHVLRIIEALWSCVSTLCTLFGACVVLIFQPWVKWCLDAWMMWFVCLNMLNLLMMYELCVCVKGFVWLIA